MFIEYEQPFNYEDNAINFHGSIHKTKRKINSSITILNMKNYLYNIKRLLVNFKHNQDLMGFVFYF